VFTFGLCHFKSDTAILLELNHIEADFSDDDVIWIGLELADGKMDYKQLLDLILGRTR